MLYRKSDHQHLEAGQGGTLVPDLCREHGMSSVSFYKWRSKYGDMDASMMMRMKKFKDESRWFKKIYVEEKLKAEIISEAM